MRAAPGTAAPASGEVRFGVKLPDRPSSFKTALMELPPGATVSATSVSGDVSASLVSGGNSDMTLKSVSGSIEIGTPSSFNADVDLTTVSGSIDSKYALHYDRRHQHADGKVGSGGADVSASTVSGSITLR